MAAILAVICQLTDFACLILEANNYTKAFVKQHKLNQVINLSKLRKLCQIQTKIKFIVD